MNYLAHMFLSGNDESVMLGNYIGDFVKGKEIYTYDAPVKKGIVLHRAIDQFTDQHEIVRKGKKRLFEKYRHYSGVIIDIFYDHFLATRWNEYHSESLKDYTEWVYSIMKNRHEELPERALVMLSYMSKDNWLYHYSSIKGIALSLEGLSKRTPFRSKMENAHHDLVQNYAIFEEEFLSFFPQIQEFCSTQLKNMTINND
ncbi:MAG: ACP phosphodiesterase [Cyclobacteriaceae bacterium]|nr:DUF479 domain-containing protein [Cyclobacteriaceae bacterium]MCH8515191.1 ACP phosphodiesterase [Cyclobacteriaceae bacterium]